MSKRAFIDFIHATNRDGSQKANSYLKALEYLEQMLDIEAFGFEDCRDLWSVASLERLQKLYELVLEQSRQHDKSPWQANDIAPSYLRDNFCSAALKSFMKYISVQTQEDRLFEEFNTFSGSGKALANEMNVELDNVILLVDGIRKEKGVDVLRNVKTRRNQNLFRRMILKLYGGRCCVSGLDIPELNIASHIVGWAEDESTRMNPSNGLCLSATYDMAFDKKLISFDDDYRMVVSREIKDHYQNETVKRYFLDYEGSRIQLPVRFEPGLEYLKTHRKLAGL